MTREEVVLNEDGTPNYIVLRKKINLSDNRYLEDALNILYARNNSLTKYLDCVPFKSYSAVVDLYNRLYCIKYIDFNASSSERINELFNTWVKKCTDEELTEAMQKVYNEYMERSSREFMESLAKVMKLK